MYEHNYPFPIHLKIRIRKNVKIYLNCIIIHVSMYNNDHQWHLLLIEFDFDTCHLYNICTVYIIIFGGIKQHMHFTSLCGCQFWIYLVYIHMYMMIYKGKDKFVNRKLVLCIYNGNHQTEKKYRVKLKIYAMHIHNWYMIIISFY